MSTRFTKMHGAGNDFMIVAAGDPDALPPATQVAAWADRHRGIGFDQFLAVLPATDDATVAAVRIFNADGSEAEQCGNGLRCVAALLATRRSLPDTFSIDTRGGRVAARIDAGGTWVALRRPSTDPHDIPFDPVGAGPFHALEVDDETVQVQVVSLGNPHAVVRTNDVASAPVAHLGARLERHVRFPNRANIEFMEIAARDRIRLRVFERGVGETLACGTGACAAVAAGILSGDLRSPVDVEVPGGRLQVDWPDRSGPIWLGGPSTIVFSGETAP